MAFKPSTTHMILFVLFSMFVFASCGRIKGENQNQENSPSAPCIESSGGKNYTCLEGPLHPQGNRTENGQYPKTPTPSAVRQGLIASRQVCAGGCCASRRPSYTRGNP